MGDFEARKKELLQPIFFEAGAALFDSQAFENGIAYLLYLMARLGTKGLEVSRVQLILDDREKKTAGQLIGLLKKYIQIDDKIEKSLAEALDARNYLIHRFFTDNIERMAMPSEHASLTEEIHKLRSTIRRCWNLFDPIVKQISMELDGEAIKAARAQFEKQFNQANNKH